MRRYENLGTVLTVKLTTTRQTSVRVHINKQLQLEQVSQLGEVENKNAFKEDNIGWIDMNVFILEARMSDKVIDRNARHLRIQQRVHCVQN